MREDINIKLLINEMKRPARNEQCSNLFALRVKTSPNSEKQGIDAVPLIKVNDGRKTNSFTCVDIK